MLSNDYNNNIYNIIIYTCKFNVYILTKINTYALRKSYYSSMIYLYNYYFLFMVVKII